MSYIVKYDQAEGRYIARSILDPEVTGQGYTFLSSIEEAEAKLHQRLSERQGVPVEKQGEIQTPKLSSR